jgi:hypothetical protein
MTEQTLGQKLVGLSFNPSGDETVNKVKTLCAEVIDLLDKQALESPEGLKNKICSDAIQQMITAQMWAVKAVTWKD